MRLESGDFDQKFAAWKRFVETGELERSVISPEIGESWNRCREYGVDPYGAKKPIRLSPGEIANKQEAHVVFLKAAEPFIQLQLSRERDNLNSYLDSILNSISEGIIAIDTRGRVIRANRVAQRNFERISTTGSPRLRLLFRPLVGVWMTLRS